LQLTLRRQFPIEPSRKRLPTHVGAPFRLGILATLRTTAVSHRSQFKRLLRVSLALFSPMQLVVAGCQSNAQQDLVARELRMQEDQIYAMEDYLAEYQKLICKYRMENAALRQRLGEDDETALPAPGPRERARNGTSPGRNGPDVEVPRPETDGTEPEPQIELPEVPPLEETSSGGFDHQSDPVVPAVAMEASEHETVIQEVWLHGEVVENDAGGPRLVVDVEPIDAGGEPARFDGSLSLMLLAADAGGGRQSLGRWDFPAEEVQLASGSENDGVIRFYLELPADTLASEATEMWVRLLPESGEKLLAHAPLDLHAPGEFSSLAEPPWPSTPGKEEPIITASHEIAPIGVGVVQTELADAGWSTAKPGEPASVPDASSAAAGEWRASDEPMPVAVASRPVVRVEPRVTTSAPKRQARRAAVADRGKPAAWSPDRPAEESDARPQMAKRERRPSWSATR
jgi:hypothetical protein